MPFPKPVEGLVIRYSYLWRAEYLRGREEGIKDRPCAVILLVTTDEGETVVTVLLITHSPPTDPTLAIEIPFLTKQRLRLEAQRSWVILDEANRFIWPGPDLGPVRPRDPTASPTDCSLAVLSLKSNASSSTCWSAAG